MPTEIQIKTKEYESLTEVVRERKRYYENQNISLKNIVEMMGYELNSFSKEALEIIHNKIECDLDNGISCQDYRIRIHNNYISKITVCIKMYAHLNELLIQEMKITESTRECNTISQLNIPTANEIKLLEAKITRYENELKKFETRYPWLKDDRYNLQSITKDMENLVFLREKIAKLVLERNKFGGLKANLHEAMSQLEEIKIQYDKMNKMFTNKIC